MKKVLDSFKNLDPQGRELVVVVREYPRGFYDPKIDFTDFKHKDIWAVIPAWKSADGTLTSLRTGKIVKVGEHDKIRPQPWGTAFDYPDGAKIIYARFWVPGDKKPEYRFIERQCRDSECIVIPAHHEHLAKAPKRNE